MIHQQTHPGRHPHPSPTAHVPRPINVLWVIDHVCYDGSLHGGGRLYWNVLPRFDASRFRVVPCLLRASDTIRQVFRQSLVPVRILEKGKFDPTTLWTLVRLIKQESIQVMHLHCYGASTFGRLAALMTGVPAIIHDYDTEVYFPYPPYLWLADRLLAPLTARAIAPSPMVRDFLTRKRGIDGDRIRTMLHAVPLDKYARPSKHKILAVRESLGIPGNARICCTVTKLGPQRGNEYLLKAAAETIRVLPDALFLLIYKPTYFHRLPSRRYVETASERTLTDLEKLANGLGIQQKARFLKWPENIDDVVSASDVMIAPFLSERFSSVNLLEAMAMGKPVVATDVGEQRDIVRNGVNGYLVPPGDVAQLARAIVKVLSNPGELDRLSREASCTARRHSVEAYVDTLQGLYQELAGT